MPYYNQTSKRSKPSHIVLCRSAKFDFEKAKWFNQYYIQHLSDKELALQVQPFLPAKCKDISLDILNYRVNVKDKVIETSPTEFKLLLYLMENMGRVLTREQILSAVWGLDFATDGAVLDTYISYLRKKLGENANIRTVRGIGYQIESK